MNIKLLFPVILSQVIEWYDFTLYGFFAGMFAVNYFPQSTPAISLLAALGVFAISFLTRPIGSLIFGVLGDKYGRKKVYLNSYLLMGLGTVSIGLTPTYHAIGIWAPIILIILRMIQGLSCGGIFTGAIVMLGEHAPLTSRYLFSSLPWIGSLSGTLLGSGVATLTALYFNQEGFYTSVWRFAYIGGGIIGLVGLFFQSSIIETKEYIANTLNKNIAKNPLFETFRSHKKLMLKIIGMNIYTAVLSYIGIIYLPIYLSSVLKYPLHNALLINTIAIFILIGLVPLFGWLCDKFGSKRIFIFSNVGFIVCGFPAFLLLGSGKDALILLGQLIIVLFAAAAMGASSGMMIEVTPARLRLSICSIGYNVAMALCGGTAPLVATLLIQESNSIFSPVYYLFLCALISHISVLFLGNLLKRH